MKVSNYKLENLLNAIKSIQKSELLGNTAKLKLARLANKLTDILLPYMQIRKEVTVQHTEKDETTGQLKAKDVVAYQEAMEQLGFEEVDFSVDSFELHVPKGSSIVTIEQMQHFIAVFNEEFECVEIE